MSDVDEIHARPKIVGARIKRTEDPRPLTGRGAYTDDRQPVGVLFVVPRPEVAFETEALLAHCRIHLSTYKVPHSVHLIAEIPRTGSGKIIRYKLRELIAGWRRKNMAGKSPRHRGDRLQAQDCRPESGIRHRTGCRKQPLVTPSLQ